jgi:sugar phosphate isomerase/epimerase
MGEKGMIRLGYGTYGMKAVDPFEAVRGLKEIGFDAIEIAATNGWPTAPPVFGLSERKRLVALFQELNLPHPVMLIQAAPCVEGDERAAMLGEFEDLCVLARDLNFEGGSSVITSTMGGRAPDWDTEKETIAGYLVELADIAKKYDVIYAIEPHVGGAFDTPEKAVWMMRHTEHPNLKLNYDYSHFWVQDRSLEESTRDCLPDAVHIHIKDGRMEDGKVKFLLPGEGELDLAKYLRTMGGVRDDLPPVTVEVSGHVWNADGYDPWKAARFCFEELNAAREEVLGA